MLFFTLLFSYINYKDKSFKIKYFLGYVIISFITGKSIGFMTKVFSEQGYTNEVKMTEILSFAFVVTFLVCYLEGFLYQIFKKISYKKSLL